MVVSDYLHMLSVYVIHVCTGQLIHRDGRRCMQHAAQLAINAIQAVDPAVCTYQSAELPTATTAATYAHGMQLLAA
jgi:hypothetical protein